MPQPPRGNEDGILLLVYNINEQVKHISEAQEQLRLYLLTQIDELRKTLIQREEYRDTLGIIKRDISALQVRMDKDISTVQDRLNTLESSLTEKIEKVGADSKAQQDANYQSVIKVQAAILGTIAVTVLGIALKVFFHIGP